MAAVLNYAPWFDVTKLDAITADIESKFAEAGSSDVRVFRLCAICHTPDHEGKVHAYAPGAINEFDALRDFIEKELTEGDIARMITQQRARVIQHLKTTVDALIPADLESRLSKIEQVARDQGEDVGTSLVHELENRLIAIDDDMLPISTKRRALLFRGPLRMALRGSEFLRFTLPRALRQKLLVSAESGARSQVEERLVTGMESKASDLLRIAASSVQQASFESELPVGRWQEITSDASGSALLHRIAGSVRARLEADMVDRTSRRRVAAVLSFFSVIVFVSFAGFGLVRVVQGLITLDTVAAYGALGLTLVGLLLCLLLLYGLAVFLVPVRRSVGAYDQAKVIVQETTQDVISGVGADLPGRY